MNATYQAYCPYMFDNKEIDGEILDKVINDNPHLRFLKIYEVL